MAIEITKQNVEQEVTQSSKPIILDVYATWCGPCQQMDPILQELEKELGDKYIFAKLNVDEERELAVKYGVTSLPTFLFMQNNEVKGKGVGFMGKDVFREKIATAFGV